jgi:hypothetical protein
MIDFELSGAEARVLGALLEKSMATPDYYPLSLNALTNACNQKSNREPVVAYDEATVLKAIDALKEKRLALRSDASRVPKFAECFVGNAKLIGREAALLCLLLLRGPQTVGELRGRAERLYDFADLAEVTATLESLAGMDMVRKMPRQPGRKESRFTQLLTGEPAEPVYEAGAAGLEGTELPVATGSGRFEQLQAEVAGLKEELAELRREFVVFKSQFD